MVTTPSHSRHPGECGDLKSQPAAFMCFLRNTCPGPRARCRDGGDGAGTRAPGLHRGCPGGVGAICGIRVPSPLIPHGYPCACGQVKAKATPKTKVTLEPGPTGVFTLPQPSRSQRKEFTGTQGTPPGTPGAIPSGEPIFTAHRGPEKSHMCAHTQTHCGALAHCHSPRPPCEVLGAPLGHCPSHQMPAG